MGGCAWVTLATNDSYALGALVLAHSLRRVNTAHQLVVLITPGVTEAMKTQLSAVFNIVKLVDVLDSRDTDNLALLARPELGITFTKLHCWKLTEFEKCVFLDADTLVLQNSDELFEREEFSAAPDAGWPDCFNSGVFVFKPSTETFKALIEFAMIHGSFDGGDQGLLNLFFSDWATKDISKHLPFVYNMCSTATYSYLPAFKQFGQGLKIVHFIGSAKPWLQPFNTETGLVQVWGDSTHVAEFVQLWWDLFCTNVHPSLSTEMAGLAGALASVTLGAPLSDEQAALEGHLRRQGWEQGHIDYMGKDSFANIWSKICETLASARGAPLETPVQTSVPVEAPAPVAPVAAPLFVSSVEMSPSGPVDTSPPANYSTVSSFSTVTPSTQEDVTVTPEPTSPFAEVVATTAKVITPALDTTVQPSFTSSSQQSAAIPLPPVKTATTETATVPSGIPVSEQSPISDPVIQPAITSSPEISLPVAIAPTGVDLPSTVQPDTEAKTITPLKEVQVPDPVVLLPPISAEPPSTPEDPSVPEVVPAPPKTPAVPSVPEVLPTLPSTPAVPLVPEVVSALPSTPAVLPVPEVEPAVMPLSPVELVQPPTPSGPLSPKTPITEVLVSQPSDPTTVVTSVAAEVPKTTVPSPASALQFVVALPETPATSPVSLLPISMGTKQAQAPPLAPGSTENIESSPNQAQATPVQPGTPTITEPTPPTSPPTAPVISPLPSKLQVETEVPATPPVVEEASSSQPALVKDEPPVPPKRKGGSKATQDNKNQKNKPAKGKK